MDTSNMPDGINKINDDINVEDDVTNEISNTKINNKESNFDIDSNNITFTINSSNFDMPKEYSNELKNISQQAYQNANNIANNTNLSEHEKNLKIKDLGIEYRKKLNNVQNNIIDDEKNRHIDTTYSDKLKSEKDLFIEKYKNELRDLQQSGFEKYGTDYANNDEYKKELEAFNKNQYDEFKNINDNNIECVNELTDTLKEVYDNNKESLKGILGPINLIAKPINDFFGDTGKKLFDTLIKNSIHNKLAKTKPNEHDVAKMMGVSGSGFLLLNNKIDKLFNKDEDVKNIDNTLNGSSLLKNNKFSNLGLGMILGGVIWSAIDGIKLALSNEFSGSKISKIITGVLSGSSNGIKNTFANAGKWALIGAGVGTLITPGIGTLIGGCAGAIIGGLLSIINKQKMIDCFDNVGNWFVKTFTLTVPNFFKNAFSSCTNWLNEKFELTNEVTSNLIKSVTQSVTNVFNKVSNAISDSWNDVKTILNKYIITPIQKLFSNIGDFFGYIGSKFDGMKSVFDIPTLIDNITNGDSFIEYKSNKQIERRNNEYDKLIKNGMNQQDAWKQAVETYPEITVNDAIIPSSINNKTISSNVTIQHNKELIRPQLDDTMIATKNPVSVFDKKTIVENTNKQIIQNNVSTNNLEKKINNICDLLKALLDKEVVSVTNPQPTRSDLMNFMLGNI